SANYSPFQPLDETLKGVLTESVENIYNVFLQRVAQGRKMTIEQVDEVAQGRVWTGTDAKRLGLIDEIGGLQEAINYAAKLAKTEKYKTIYFPVFKKTTQEFFDDFNPFMVTKTKESMIKDEIGEENYQILQRVKNLQTKSGVQAMMPYEIIIR